MKVVALVSGGKDSCYAMYLAQQEGHEIVALANLLPAEHQPDELDSFMYQTVGHQLVEAYAECMGVPLFRRRISGTSARQALDYSQTEGDEVEDLYVLLSYVKDVMPCITAVSSGAIASDYQRLRVENVCSRLNLVSLAYLWHMPQRTLLRGMVESGIHAVVAKVAALGLDPRKHLGRSIAALEPHLHHLNQEYGSNVCGEGGEYETLTLDCPVFTRGRVALDSYEVVMHSDDPVAPVGYLVPTAFHVEAKTGPTASSPTSPLGSHMGSPSAADGSQAAAAGRSEGGHPGHLTQGAAAGCGQQQGEGQQLQPPVVVTGRKSISVRDSVPATVHLVPGDYAPAQGAPKSGSEPARAGAYDIHVRSRAGRDYVQLCCWPSLRNSHGLSKEFTECDASDALHDALTVLKAHLEKDGLELHNAIFVHLYISNMGHFAACNAVYCKHFPLFNPPSRACVQVPLPPNQPVMVDVLLARGAYTPAATPPIDDTESTDTSPDASTQQVNPAQESGAGSNGHTATVSSSADGGVSGPRYGRKALHVQSISAWAPSCIGPYSQANAYKGFVHLAGSIPLQPASMAVVQGDAAGQTLRALANSEAVAVAMRTSVFKASVGLVIYYASSIGAAGKELVRACLASVLEHGLPPPAKLETLCNNALHAATKRMSATNVAIHVPVSGFHRMSLQDLASVGAPGVWRGKMSPVTPSSALASPVIAGSPATALGMSGLSSGCGWGASGGLGGGLAGSGSAVGGWSSTLGSSFGGGHTNRNSNWLHMSVEDEEEEEGEDEEAAAAALCKPDPYLEPPKIKSQVRVNAVLLEVPALPRGSLVEVQPLLVDVAFLDQHAATSDGGDGEGDGRGRCGCCGPAPITIGPAAGPAASATGATPAGASGGGSSMSGGGGAGAAPGRDAGAASSGGGAAAQAPAASAPVQPSASASALDSGDVPAVNGGTSTSSDTQGRDGPVSGQEQGHAAGQVQAPTGAQVQGQDNGQGQEQGQAQGHPRHHHRTVTSDSCHASISSLDSGSLDEASASAPHSASDEVMVTSICCNQYGFCKSLFHLPADVFKTTAVNKRLQHAIQVIFASYKYSEADLVQSRGWYDVNQVSAAAAQELMHMQPPNFHITWTPVQSVSTTAMSTPIAAVLEVLAQLPL